MLNLFLLSSSNYWGIGESFDTIHLISFKTFLKIWLSSRWETLIHEDWTHIVDILGVLLDYASILKNKKQKLDLIWSCNSSQIGNFLLSVFPVISKFSSLLPSDLEVELWWCLMDCIMSFGPSNFVCFPLAIQIMYKGFRREQICMIRMGEETMKFAGFNWQQHILLWSAVYFDWLLKPCEIKE